MWLASEMAAFAHVAELKSFTAAARALRRPHSQRLLAEVDAVSARFAPPAAAERRLRVVVDPGYGRLLVTPLIPRFLERYGDFELQVAVIDTLPVDPGAD